MELPKIIKNRLSAGDTTSSMYSIRNSCFEFLSRKRIFMTITIAPVMIILIFIMLLPILWAVFASFNDVSAYSPEMTWVGVQNFVTVLSDPGFWSSMGRSVIFAGGAIGIQLIVGVAIALALNQSFRFSTMIRALFLLPYLVPTAVLGYIALWMGNTQWGIINGLMLRFGLIQDQIAWFGNFDLAMLSVILTTSWKFSIFVTIFTLARLQSIPDGYYEAAEIAGASMYQKFRDITLPNLRSMIFIVLLLRGVWMFNKFDIIWVLTEGGPAKKTTTAPIYSYLIAFVETSLGEASAVAVLLFLLLACVAAVYFTVFNPEEEVNVE